MVQAAHKTGKLQGYRIQLYFVHSNTGRFILISTNTNICNKKTKGPTLMELLTATGKLKKIILTTINVRCVHHGWHDTHRYDIQILATHALTWVHRYSSLLQRSVPFGQRGHMAMVGRISGLWHILKEKTEGLMSGDLEGHSINPYPTAFPYRNGMVLHFYQQQESSTTKTVHKVIKKGLKTYV